MSRRAVLRRWSLAAASAVTVLAVTPMAAAAQFSSLTFFGDSFTDMGMGDILAGIAGIPDPTPSPPYWPGPAPANFPGTATNGPTWAQYFATILGRPADAAPALAGGNNFAISGARTGFTNVAGDPFPVNIPAGVYPTGLRSQLQLFNGTFPLVPTAPRAIDPTGLYAIWGGVNDIRDIAQLPAAQWPAMIAAAVANLDLIARGLVAGGATELLIPLAPNSATAPEVALYPSPAATFAARNALTAQFNTALGNALGQLALDFPGVRFTTFDLDALYAQVQADALAGGPRFGITNLTVPCFLNYGTTAQIPCDISLFSDGLHPTTRAQALVGLVAAQALAPEPATVVLVAGGLALLAVGARRTRRG